MRLTVYIYVHIEYFSLSFLLRHEYELYSVHLIQGIVTIQSIKIPNRVTVTQRKCNGVCSYRSSKASGKWETIPTNLFGGNYTQCFVILLII